MRTIYQVWSAHRIDMETTEDHLETRRTSKQDALNDVDILKTIMHRHAWIQEVGGDGASRTHTERKAP